MKRTRMKVDFFAGISLIVLFALMLFLTVSIRRITLGFYFFMSVLFIGSLIAYYKGIMVSLGMSMIIDFIYGTLLVIQITGANRTITTIEIISFIIIPVCYVCIGSLGQTIGDLSKNNEKLALQNERLVRVDALTGLKNTSAFLDNLKMYMRLCERHQLPLCVMIVKLRYGKRIRTIVGEKGYEELEKQIAKVLQRTLREEDITYYLREEESFASILVTDETNREIVRSRIVGHIQAIEFDEGSPLKDIKIELRIAFKQYDHAIKSPLEYMEQVNKELEYDV